MNFFILCTDLHKINNLSAAIFQAHYPLALGLLLNYVQPSGLEVLDKPCTRVRRELTIIRSLVNVISHSATQPLSHVITWQMNWKNKLNSEEIEM